MSFIPAWADAFVPERLKPGPPIAFPRAISRKWAYGNGLGTGVKVAVVDSGVDVNHPAVGSLAGGAVLEPDEEGLNGVRVSEREHEDLFGHGTACAGIIRSLAPDVELYSVRVLGAKLTGRAYVVARGIEWCLEQHVDVINLSLSTGNDDWFGGFHELCDEAAYAGVVIVGALNNARRASYPSEFSSVMSVAAMPGHDREVFACNPEPPAEWGAPGIDVEVPWLDGRTLVTTGNSFAAPIIAGHVARILGAHPGLMPWQVRTILAALAVNAGKRARE